MEIYVFRHGETDWNRDMRWQGHTDIPLNQKGRTQALELVPLLKSLRLSKIIASDLSRALETGTVVAKALGCPLVSHFGFRELGFGEAEGLTFEEIGLRFGPESQSKIRSTDDADLDFSFPGGESKRQMLRRAHQALADLVDPAQDQRIGLATHGGVIRTFLQMCGLKDRAKVTIPNGSLFLFEYQGDGHPLVYRGRVNEGP
jgi:broad specificity phosphatase PhoE